MDRLRLIDAAAEQVAQRFDERRVVEEGVDLIGGDVVHGSFRGDLEKSAVLVCHCGSGRTCQRIMTRHLPPVSQRLQDRTLRPA